MEENRMTGRVTIPTDLDVVPETLQILKKWGADAIRDCDGTEMPKELLTDPAKGCRRKDLLHLLHHPQGQRVGQGEPGRGAAVLHYDRLLHRPR